MENSVKECSYCKPKTFPISDFIGTYKNGTPREFSTCKHCRTKKKKDKKTKRILCEKNELCLTCGQEWTFSGRRSCGYCRLDNQKYQRELKKSKVPK